LSFILSMRLLLSKGPCPAVEQQVASLFEWAPNNVLRWLLSNPNGPNRSEQASNLLQSLMWGGGGGAERNLRPAAGGEPGVTAGGERVDVFDNGGRVSPDAIDILRQKINAGEVQFRKTLDGSERAYIVRDQDGTFRNSPPPSSMGPHILGGLDIVRHPGKYVSIIAWYRPASAARPCATRRSRRS
jgi:hypothetical protein